ncbi:MAG: hypothetical protein A2V70_14325 [Planctomycetes bacterium RBG_13_63_9]|nr:MAG: hypothetical protein A2V70_14325 [Planctomycetes bacterium RBG_13_63_9]
MVATLLAHADANLASEPWWYSDLFVPIGVGVLGSLLTLVGGLVILARTEWYRRLSRWERYSEQLWLQQVDLYSHVCVAASEVNGAARELVYQSRQADAEMERRLGSAYEEKSNALNVLRIKANVLLTSDFNEVLNNFWHTLFLFTTESRVDTRSLERLWQFSDELIAGRAHLIEAARRSLGIDELSENARKAFVEDMKAHTQEDKNEKEEEKRAP